MALTSESTDSPLIARAAAVISDTYFLESWGLEGSIDALESRIEWYGKLLQQTKDFAATLTEEEREALPMPPRGETASSTVGAA